MNIERPNLEQLFSELDSIAISSNDFKESTSTCFDRIMAAMGAGRGFLLLCKGKESEWEPLAGKGINLDTLFETEAVSTTIIRFVVERNMPIITTNAMVDPRFAQKQSVQQSEIRSVLCTPLMSEKGLFGVIYLDNRFTDDFFDGKDKDYLVRCAEKLSTLITRLPGNPVKP